MMSTRHATTFSSLQVTDAHRAAELHQAAFPDFFLSQLGLPFLREFYRGYATDSTAVTVAARDQRGELVGIVVGTTEPGGFYGRLLRRRAMGFVTASARAALRSPSFTPRLVRALQYRGDAPDAEAGWALLSSISVDPAAQGTGLGRALATRWSVAAYAAGAREAYLTTDATDNEPVNRFYTSMGWALHDTYATPEGRVMNRYVLQLPGVPA